ncbi:MAG: hypothetical protein ACREJ6_10775, partial [Candidatus Methylomirabilis sp.]
MTRVRGFFMDCQGNWLLSLLLVVGLLGCAATEERVVAKARRLVVAGRSSEALQLLHTYLEQTPEAVGARRLKILLSIEAQRSEEALADYEAMSGSQKKADPALLHQLALG